MANVTFSLYELQRGGAPLFVENQTVSIDAQGRYSVLLGATQANGLPLELFTSGKAMWLGVQTQASGGVEQARVLLIAVPYALKAADSDTLGGKPASAYALAGSTTLVPVGVGSQAPSSSSGRSAGLTRVEGASFPQPAAPCGSVTSDGTATANTIAKFTAACNIQKSDISDVSSKIGVFTTSPTYDFDLAKSQNQDTVFRVRNPNTGSSARANLRLEADSAIFSVIAQSVANGKSLLFQAQNDNNLAFQQISNAPITFYANNIERMRILGSGNVGIGTAAPGALLEVKGTAKFDNSVTVTSLTSGKCLQAGAGGLLTTTAFACSAGGGSVTSVGTGLGLTGGPITTSGTLSIDTTVVPRLTVSNTFTTPQLVNGYVDAFPTGNSVALYGFNTSTDSKHPTLFLSNSDNTSARDLVFQAQGPSFGGSCTIDVSGNLFCTGTLAPVIKKANGSAAALYTVQSSENWIEDFGSATLANGAAVIALRTDLAEAVSALASYHVFVTPNGDCEGLFVTNRTPTSFEVRELRGGKSSVSFDYRIVAHRKGFEAARLPELSATLQGK
jgi:hypothetical protein